MTGVPSLEDLKQRDHRKLAVIDGAVALLVGRNLSHEYYTGLRGGAAHAAIDVAPGPVARRRRARRGPGRRGAGAFLPRGLDRDAEARRTRSSRRPPPDRRRQARLVIHHGLRDACYTRGLPRAHRDGHVPRLRRQRLPADPGDPACAPARARPGRPGAGALWEPHADARRHALRRAMVHGANRRDGAGPLPHGCARGGRRRGLPVRGARAARLGDWASVPCTPMSTPRS